jgi:aldehyde dehydrogenase (NAD+)
MKTILINGTWQEAEDQRLIEVLEPATGRVFTELSRGGAGDIDRAVSSARHAFEMGWGQYSATERGRILLNIGARILENAEEIAKVESQDTGKPLHLARSDIAASARYFEYYGSAADKHHGEVIPYLNNYSVNVVYEPLGVTAHIIPWNYPSQLFGRTVCPALATGNAVVVKPSEEACQSILLISKIACEAGLPAGALNIVTGYGVEAGEALASHPGINLLTFTGSPGVGARVQKAAAENHVPCVLELGGKSPQIVFEDANLGKAIPAVVAGFIQNTGQTCSAGTRLLVQESIYDIVVERLAAQVSQVKAGMPDSDAECGPIITSAQFKRVQDFIDRIHVSGIELLAQGALDTVDDGGFFIPPMVFGPVPREHELALEEVFGPVLAVIPFKDEKDAVKLANATDYGLVAGVWTENGSRQHRMAHSIAAGQVFINCFGAGGGVELPFGGVKKSGYGREKGFLAMDEFTTTKTIVNHYQ